MRTRRHGFDLVVESAGEPHGFELALDLVRTPDILAEVAARFGLRASRIAHGVPVGGELEYVDGGTLAWRGLRT